MAELSQSGARDRDGGDSSRQGAHGPKLVLVVDDEAGSRLILQRMLAKGGYVCCQAATMAEAQALVQQHAFDLILMDLIMPEADGPANIRRLRAQGVRVPILICTGHVDETDIEAGLQAGANGVLRKPFSSLEFSRMLAQQFA